jgi:hypothetical protein
MLFSSAVFDYVQVSWFISLKKSRNANNHYLLQIPVMYKKLPP